MGKSTSYGTYLKPRHKVVSPAGIQLITEKDRANFALEQPGTTYCNVFVSAELQLPSTRNIY